MRYRTAVLLLAAGLALSGCGGGPNETERARAGDPADPTPARRTPLAASSPTQNDQIYTTSGMVLEDESHGPQVCFSGGPLILPPQCEGTDITNWDWDAVTGEESQKGTTWGHYTLVGTFDGRSITLTEPPSAAVPETRGRPPRPDFTSPCAPPEGGWVVPDPETATGPALRAAGSYAQGQPDGAGWWLDHSFRPAYPDSAADLDEKRPEDHVSRLVLNFRFTGDLDLHKVELRKRWGGAMCVLQVDQSRAELERILNDLTTEPNIHGGSVEITTNDIWLDVMVNDGLQNRLDQKYGEGTIRVDAHLRPAN